jgi:hypothetical protein
MTQYGYEIKLEEIIRQMADKIPKIKFSWDFS